MPKPGHDVETCGFDTTVVKGALSQPARGGGLRYRRCKNRATTSVAITETSLAGGTRVREVPCCGLHKRKHDEEGWLP